MWEVFKTLAAGGVMMFVNLGISVVAVAVILLRVYVLWFKYRLSPTAFADSIVASVDQGNYAGAVQMASQKADHPMGAIMKDMLLKADRSDREIERAFEVSAQRELPRMKRLTSFLPQAGNLATLVGLLGTIQGLIEAFGGATAEDAATRQQVLAKGITVAFYNTFFGLAIAVSCALAFIVLNGRQSMIIEATENALMRVRERIYERNRSIRTSRSGG
ncbi:MAG TPA: MotA/TolQ/ExbB proton channel family protein [Myxococcales bacterium LLY-WYZ-16_1]|jgi:biopolymer transport protein ExbB|nr:MotA/TolQ/ExbB proton channel family protein [Myxococcales bacterium LLY-WYZ-16_1]